MVNQTDRKLIVDLKIIFSSLTMKILFFTENTHFGGLDNFLISLINHWPNSSDEISIICNQSHPGLPFLRKRLKRECFIDSNRLLLDWEVLSKFEFYFPTKFFKRVVGFIIRYPFFIYYIIRLYKLFKKGNHDRLMIVNGGYPAGNSNRAASIAWGLLGKSKSIHNFHNIAVKPSGLTAWLENLIDYFVHDHSKAFVSPSNSCSETIRARSRFTNSKKITFIYNGTEKATNYSPYKSSLKEKIGIPDNGLVCSMLGTYEPRKGHLFLLKCLASVLENTPNVYFVFSGYGSQKEIQKVGFLVDQMGLGKNVFLEDASINKDELYSITDIVISGSQEYESFGLTLIEAMCRKIPIVCTKVGGMVEVMGNDDGGYCVEKDCVKTFSQQLNKLLTNKKLRVMKGKKGYERYLQLFKAENMSMAYKELIYLEERSNMNLLHIFNSTISKK